MLACRKGHRRRLPRNNRIASTLFELRPVGADENHEPSDESIWADQSLEFALERLFIDLIALAERLQLSLLARRIIAYRLTIKKSIAARNLWSMEWQYQASAGFRPSSKTPRILSSIAASTHRTSPRSIVKY